MYLGNGVLELYRDGSRSRGPKRWPTAISSSVTASSQSPAALDVASASVPNSANRSASSLERDSTSSSKISSTTSSLYFVEYIYSPLQSLLAGWVASLLNSESVTR